MEHFNGKTGLLKTKYKSAVYIDRVFTIFLYLYTATILRKLVDCMSHYKLYHGQVRMSPMHPTIQKLYTLYSFWINKSYVTKLDYCIIQHVVLSKEETDLFNHLTDLVNVLSTLDTKYAKIYYNLNVAEILIHDYPDIPILTLPHIWTKETKLDTAYNIVHALPEELLSVFYRQCKECWDKPVSGLSLNRVIRF
jgi:hypothetical protein